MNEEKEQLTVGIPELLKLGKTMNLEVHSINECPAFGSSLILICEGLVTKWALISTTGVVTIDKLEETVCWDFLLKNYNYIGWVYGHDWNVRENELYDIKNNREYIK